MCIRINKCMTDTTGPDSLKLTTQQPCTPTSGDTSYTVTFISLKLELEKKLILNCLQLDGFGGPTKYPVAVNCSDNCSMCRDRNKMFSQWSTTNSWETEHRQRSTVSTVVISGAWEMGESTNDANISSQLSLWQSIDRVRGVEPLWAIFGRFCTFSESNNRFDTDADEFGCGWPHSCKRSVAENWIYGHVTVFRPFGNRNVSTTSWKWSTRKTPPSSDVCINGHPPCWPMLTVQSLEPQQWPVADDSLVVEGHAPTTQSIDPVWSHSCRRPVDRLVPRQPITSWNKVHITAIDFVRRRKYIESFTLQSCVFITKHSKHTK